MLEMLMHDGEITLVELFPLNQLFPLSQLVHPAFHLFFSRSPAQLEKKQNHLCKIVTTVQYIRHPLGAEAYSQAAYRALGSKVLKTDTVYARKDFQFLMTIAWQS
jgi:hypothetical protein